MNLTSRWRSSPAGKMTPRDVGEARETQMDLTNRWRASPTLRGPRERLASLAKRSSTSPAANELRQRSAGLANGW